jgi:acyl-CoA thioesterase I
VIRQDASVTHFDDALAALRQRGVMRDDEQRRPRRRLPFKQQVHDRRASRGVQIAGGLVGKEQGGAWRDRARDGDALLLATRQLRGIMIQPVAKADRAQFVSSNGKGVRLPRQFERHRDIFQRGHGGKQMKGLEDDADPTAPGACQIILPQGAEIDPANFHPSPACPLQPCQHRHQRAFARSRRAQYGDALPALHMQVDPLEDRYRGLAGSKLKRDILGTNGDSCRIEWRMHEGNGSLAGRLTQYGALTLIVHLTAGCSPDAPPPPPAREQAQRVEPPARATPSADRKLVVAFGDSLYAGYNLDQGQGLAPVLERALADRGLKAQVVNAGVSGDTTTAGRARLAFTLDGLPRTPDLMLVGLGGNDMLRGLSPQETRDNLDAILREAKARGIPVMLTGMLASPNMGADYAAAFNPIFPDLAHKYDAALYPFMLDGVLGDRTLLLPDGIHPNARGVTVIARRLAPIVAQNLKG